jgi:hypothetical protein
MPTPSKPASSQRTTNAARSGKGQANRRRISEAGVGFGGLDVRERKWSENCMTQMTE